MIWISSWGPLKLCDAIRRTTSAPPGQNPAGQDLEASLSRSPSHDSNAPIKPKSQSSLSNIVARLTAIRGCIGPISKLQSRRALDTGRHAVRESGHWHETDMPKYLGDVRCWVNSGKHLLSLSFSVFDPGCVKTPSSNSRVEILSRLC